jgi:hypothetical protein
MERSVSPHGDANENNSHYRDTTERGQAFAKRNLIRRKLPA